MSDIKHALRRSITKRPADDKGTTSSSVKKLYFGPSINRNSSSSSEQKQTESEANIDDKISLASNLKLSSIGICYILPSEDPSVPENAKTPAKLQIRHSLRPDYQLLFKEDYTSASVLVIGDLVLSDEFRMELENTQNNFPSPVKIICKPAIKPTYENITEADFFIFLIQLDKFYSINDTRSRVMEIRRHLKTLSFRSLVVGISSPIGPYADVIPMEDFHNLLVEYQIPSVTFSSTNRERKAYVMQKIISIIVSSSRGNMSDPIIRCGLSSPTQGQELLV